MNNKKSTARIVSIVKELTPPIVLRLLNSLRVKLKKGSTKSQLDWHKVNAGPLIDRYLYIENYHAGSAMLSGTYDRKLFEAAAEIISDCEIIMDIGAHIGYHTLAFAAMSKKSRVISYEPSIANFQRLRTCLQRNQDLQDRISLKNLAVGAREGEMELMVSDDFSRGLNSMCFLSPLSDTIHTKRSSDYTTFRPVPVQVVSLDHEITEITKRIGMVKIDVEGAEVEVIEGGKSFISTHKPFLFIEIHSVALAVRLSNLFNELQYSMKVIDDQTRNRCIIKASPRK